MIWLVNFLEISVLYWFIYSTQMVVIWFYQSQQDNLQQDIDVVQDFFMQGMKI